MKIKNITLLSVDEFCKYKKYIPPVSYEYWLRGPEPVYEDKACYVHHNDFYCDGQLFNRFAVRPALIVSDLNANPGDRIKCFNLEWVVLNSNLIFCCDSIFNYYFDAANNFWEISLLKIKLDNWLDEQLPEHELFVNIRNKTEWELFKTLCKKYNIIMDNAITYNEWVDRCIFQQIIYMPYKKCVFTLKTSLNNSKFNTYSFAEFCDYITKEK